MLNFNIIKNGLYYDENIKDYRKPYIKELLERDNKILHHYSKALTEKQYNTVQSVFNYSQKNGGTIDSHCYYNDYVIIDK